MNRGLGHLCPTDGVEAVEEMHVVGNHTSAILFDVEGKLSIVDRSAGLVLQAQEQAAIGRDSDRGKKSHCSVCGSGVFATSTDRAVGFLSSIGVSTNRSLLLGLENQTGASCDWSRLRSRKEIPLL